MRFVFIFLLILFANFLNSQDEIDQYRSTQTKHSIGLNELSKDSIYAVDISFVNNISDFVFDSVHQVLLSYFALYADGGGKTNFDYITAYSLNERKVLWSKLVDRTKEKYDYINGKLYVNSSKFNGLLDVLKDMFIWKTKSNIIVNSDLLAKNIVLAPQYKNSQGVKVCAALNSSNGKPIWENDNLDLKMGIVTEPTVKGDNVIFLNEYLYNLNINTGKFWKSETQMNIILGKDEKILGEIGLTMLSAAFGFGIAGALGSNMVTFYIIDLGQSGLKTKASLYINDSGFIYVLGKEGMQKYDSTGKMMVSIGHSNRNKIEKILIARDHLYFLDPGSSIVNNKKISFFNSYFYLGQLSRNLETEKSIHLTDEYEMLYKELGKFYIQTDFSRDHFFVLFRNGVLVLDTNLRIAGKFSRSKNEDPEYRSLLLGNFYESNDSKWRKHSFTEENIYLERLDKSIDVVNSRFQLHSNIPRKDIYKIFYQDNLITVVVNIDGKSFILDSQDRTIIDMLRVEKVLRQNGKYFIANLNGYYIIDENQLVKP